MKKLIVTLFIGIILVGMILISYMNYQSLLFIDDLPAISSYQEDYQRQFHKDKVWVPGL